MLLYSSLVHVPQQQYSCRKTRERQLVHGTPVQLLRSQTEAVAYKPTLARPSARKSRYGIGGGRCGGCVSHRQELSTSPSCCCCCKPEFDPTLRLIEPTRCSRLAEHALHPGAIAARLGSKQSPRAARAEAARVGRWWPWFDSNGVPFSYSSTIGVPAANCCLP